jgi:site-specific DNA recombinase
MTTKRGIPEAELWDAGYVRVSTDMQVERDALQNQIQALEAYVKIHGLNLRLYKDEGISAKDTDRPDLQRLLTDVRAHRIRSVLVTKLDRVSRSLADLLDLMRLFEDHGVKFISLRDNIDTAGPVGRFMLHILGAIAELERGITAERVAEDMKLRAKRGKWNGGMAPFGRRFEDGHLTTVAEEADLLHHIRHLLLQIRTWRGVAVSLNRAGYRTRGWESVERDGRVVRKGHEPAEWVPVSVKRVLLQSINTGTLVYNRHQVKGRTAVPRPVEEHVVVPDFCEPIFSREEMGELLRVAKEIEGTPSRRTSSQHLLSGLVECTCGSKMYGVNSYVTTKKERYCVRYYRCRRASSKGTCGAKHIPAAIVEELVLTELSSLSLNGQRVQELSGEAQSAYASEVRPLLDRRDTVARESERLGNRLESLIDLAEERLITKEEFATRRSQLESQRANLSVDLGRLETEINARLSSMIDVDATLRGLQHLGDVLDELEDVRDRRRLITTCLNRVVVQDGGLELHIPAHPRVLDLASHPALEPFAPGVAESVDRLNGSDTIRAEERWREGDNHPENYGVGERRGVPAGILAIANARAPALLRSSRATSIGCLARCWIGSTFIWRCRGWTTRSSPICAWVSRRR